MNYNRECASCGLQYYACRKCIDIGSWKNICCSRECFRKLISQNKAQFPNIIREEEDSMPMVLRAGLVNGKTIDIVGYDLELGRFDCSDQATRTFDSFEYFIIPKEEMKEISTRMAKIVELSKDNDSPVQPSRNIYTTRSKRSDS